MAASAEGSATITIRGPLRRDDLPGLFERTCRLLSEHRCEVLVCEVAEIAPDAVALDALARLALAASRQGCAVRLRGACEQLRMLVALAGLAEVLPATARAAGALRTAGRSSR